MARKKSQFLNNQFKIPILITSVILILSFAVSKLLFKSKPVDINMIAPNTTSAPSGDIPNSICGTVKTFKVSSLCSGTSRFRIATFTCSTTSEPQTIGSYKSPCTSVANLFNAVYSKCASICIAPSPTPQASATPIPSPIAISDNVIYSYSTRPRLYYGLYDGYLNITINRDNGESYNYAVRSYNAANYIELPFTTNSNEKLNLKINANTNNLVNPENFARGWTSPSSNKCGLPPYGLVDISNFMLNVQNLNPSQNIISTQCWAGDTYGDDFNDFVLVWTNTP